MTLPPTSRLLGAAAALAGLCACEYGMTLPAEEPYPDGPAKTGVSEARVRRPILPGTLTGPAPPDAGIRPYQCDDMTDGGSVRGPDCVTDTITCGQTVVGHTRGGTNNFTTRFYELGYCWPATVQKDGGDERVYKFELPAQTRAYVTLDTPCADLDVAAIKWSGSLCPTEANRITQCEMLRKDGTERETILFESINKTDWLLAVEGAGSEEGAFSLTVQCIVRP